MSNTHIHRSSGHYIGQVRQAGHRRWETVTENHEKPEAALAAAATYMAGKKRARVLFIDNSGYYEPNLIMEASFV